MDSPARASRLEKGEVLLYSKEISQRCAAIVQQQLGCDGAKRNQVFIGEASTRGENRARRQMTMLLRRSRGGGGGGVVLLRRQVEG